MYVIKLDSEENIKLLIDFLPKTMRAYYTIGGCKQWKYFAYPSIYNPDAGYYPGDHLTNNRLCQSTTREEISVQEFIKIMSKDKKIIGYKCPMDLFEGNVKKGFTYTDYDCYKMYMPKEAAAGAIKGYSAEDFELPKEIVETWVPVYEEEFKEGDWVIFTTASDNQTHVSKIKVWGCSNFCELENGLKPFKHLLKKATPEEIEAAQVKIFKMTASNGNFELEVSGKGIYYKPEKVYLDIDFLWQFTNKGCKLPVKGAGHTSAYTVEVTKVDVGCKKDTLVSEWKLVYDHYKSLV